jgi:hypothetical protein
MLFVRFVFFSLLLASAMIHGSGARAFAKGKDLTHVTA